MSNLDAPGIINSDEIIEKFLQSIELPNDPDIIECVKNSVRHMPIEDLEMIMEKGLIVRKTDGKSGFLNSRRSRGKDGNLRYVIKLNPDLNEPFVFAHECAHFAEKVNGLYKDHEFVEVLNNLGKHISSIEIGSIEGEWYCVAKSDLFIEPYQGRTYIKHLGRYGPERQIELVDFVEYISDGYECYIGDPKLLESKDIMLYNLNYSRKRISTEISAHEYI